MSGWFDKYAQSTARSNVSRRRVLAGSAAVGATWTVPVIFASKAAAVGLSTCASPNVLCQGSTWNNNRCCTATEICYPSTTGPASCEAPGTVGGECTNNGVGICFGSTKCNAASNGNACNHCQYPHTCGGEGAGCTTNADCYGSSATPALSICTATGNLPLSNGSTPKVCRRICTSNTGCATGQDCVTVTGLSVMVCATRCTADNQCSGSTCGTVAGSGTQKYCNYAG